MKKTFIISVLIIVSNSLATAQEEKIDSIKINLNKNSINFSYGIASAHLSYEKLYKSKGKVFGGRNSTIVDFGLGGVGAWEGAVPYIISRFGILTGSGSRHFEAKAGILYLPTEGVLFPSGAIGYRKQKPGSHFIFRTGIGLPDLLYLSWGYSF
jgi:hypothetical protein